MAQAKKKTATKTNKKSASRTKTGSRQNTRTNKKQQQEQGSNMFFVISMSMLAAVLLFADLLMLNS